jgi:diguanylate cyclase (GGDEF)-like protein/PAS domain S-box-containing protein
MGISLRSLLILAFAVQGLGVASLVGFQSYRSGQRTVTDLAQQVMAETGGRVTHHLDAYLDQAQTLNQAHLAALESGAISLTDLDTLHRYLTLQLLAHEDVTSLLFGDALGNFRLVHRVAPDTLESRQLGAGELPVEVGIATAADPERLALYSIDANGNPDRPIQTLQNFNGRDRPWYQLAAEQRGPGWSPPFQTGPTDLLAINAYAPIYDGQSNLQGVFAVNLNLRQVSDFIGELPITDYGKIFVVDRQGRTIAKSTQDPAALIRPQGSSPNLPDIQVFESPDPHLQAVTQQVESEWGGWDGLARAQSTRLTVSGREYYLRIEPYSQGLNWLIDGNHTETTPAPLDSQGDGGVQWLIVTLVPEAAFTANIEANLRRTLLLVVGIFLGGLGFGLWVTGRVIQPLQRANQAAHQYGAGKTPDPVETSGIQELDALALALRQMMTDLDLQTRKNDEWQANYAYTLECQVAERTEELRSLTHQLQEAQRIAKVGSWELDVATQAISWSPEISRIMGMPPGAAAPDYDRILALIHPDDREDWHQAVQRVITEGVTYTLEHRILRPDGTCRYMVSRGEAVRNLDGHIVKLQGTGADITDRKRAELAQMQLTQELVIWRERYDIATWAGQQVLYEYDLEADSYTWGPNTEKIFGYAIEAMPANLDDNLALIHPDDQATFVQQIVDERSGKLAKCQLEMRVRHHNGDYIWIENKGIVQTDDLCRPTVTIGFIKDINERKRAEFLLRETNLRQQTILSALPDLAYLLGADGTVLERVTIRPDIDLFTDADIVGQPLSDFETPERTQRKMEAIQAALATGKVQVYEQSVQIQGEVRYEEVRCAPMVPDRVLFMYRDITDRKAAELALQASEERRRLALELTQTGSWEFDLITGEANWSDSHYRLMGLTPGSVPSNYLTWRDYVHPEDLERTETAFKTAIDNHCPLEVEYRVIHPDGTERWMLTKGRGIYDPDGNPQKMTGVMFDISDRKAAEFERQRLHAQLKIQATIDSLTQVANRRQFETVFAQVWPQHRRQRQPLALMMVDIDHFKAYNDHYGHLAGDDCLKQVAKVLSDCAHRASDLVARYGGEEFIILLPNTEASGALTLAELMQTEIAALNIPHGASPTQPYVTFSIGIAAITPPTHLSPDAAIAAADHALYQAKQTRDTICTHRLSQNDDAVYR